MRLRAFSLATSTGAVQGPAVPFQAKQIRLGRAAGNDVVVDDVGASRVHCRLHQEGGLFFLEDLGSANGTWVNGERIQRVTALRSGDLISVGSSSFIFTVAEGAAAAQPNGETVIGPAPTRSPARPPVATAERHRGGDQRPA